MKRLLVAEKPSVAADLAKVLGKFTKQGDVYENDELVIASALGHLVELFMPDDIDKKLKFWSVQTLPIIPEPFQLKPIDRTKEKFQTLKKLFARKDIGEVINACDAGREGELIFAYLYDLTKCKKPSKRMWMSSMTPQAIKDAFASLRTAEEMLPLENAARSRSESDWLIGINGTRAVTLRMMGRRSKQMATVGRVQTPTLTLVYDREIAIRNFKPTPYWRITGEFGIHNGQYEGNYIRQDFKKNANEHDRADRIWEQAEAERILAAVKDATEAKVEEQTKRTTQSPPMLYDLTALQRECNSRFGFSAARTLQIAQALYEKHKVLTYPRTDSKALPEDYVATCTNVLGQLPEFYAPFGQEILKNNWVDGKNRRVFNNKKISDHFAIIPTGQTPKSLSEQEQKVFDAVTKRFLSVFYPAAEHDVTTRISTVAEQYAFKTEGKVLVKAGWLAVYGKDTQDKDTLPALSDNDGTPPIAKVLKAELNEDTTRPPARYTEATLLAAMEGAGKFVEDDELADAMKEKGLGTPATRAQIIDHLVREQYLARDRRDLIPTTKAESLIEFLKIVNIEVLTSPSLTGEWEHKLRDVEHGKMTREAFMDGIRDLTQKIVERTKNFDETSAGTREMSVIAPTDNKPMIETFRAYRSEDGAITIYKTMGGRRISEEEVAELLEKKVIGPLDGFTSKTGKPFSASLKLEDDYKVVFDFGQSESDDAEQIDFTEREPLCRCPNAAKDLCKDKTGQVFETDSAYICEHYNPKDGCKFRISKQILGRDIPKDQFVKLIETGKTDLLDNFISKRTKRPFKAYLVFKKDGGIGFEFEPRAKK